VTEAQPVGLSETALDALARSHGIVLTPQWRASLVIGSRVAQIYAERVCPPASPPA
jgi:hypothetical protein